MLGLAKVDHSQETSGSIPGLTAQTCHGGQPFARAQVKLCMTKQNKARASEFTRVTQRNKSRTRECTRDEAKQVARECIHWRVKTGGSIFVAAKQQQNLKILGSTFPGPPNAETPPRGRSRRGESVFEGPVAQRGPERP